MSDQDADAMDEPRVSYQTMRKRRACVLARGLLCFALRDYMRAPNFLRWTQTLMIVAAATFGCGEDEPSKPGDFVSDNLFGGGRGDEGGGQASGEDDNGGGDDVIAEADVVHVEGNIVYALSRLSGLSIVDVSDHEKLRVLGRNRPGGTPFEMYIADTTAFVMANEFGGYEWDAASETEVWRQRSRLDVLNVSDPRNITETAVFDIPGSVQDSRKVGDFVYVVTYENGWCWNCESTPRTTVTAIDLSDPANPVLADQVAFSDPEESYGGWQRSVFTTTERLFVSGWEYDVGAQDDGESTITIVDISAGDGSLRVGAQFDVAGQISNRWQMDEYEGVLRVVSQPGSWGSGAAPIIETFQITAYDDVAPLGRTSMVLPEPETLRSVRFDGDRGYAITARETDPLFTLDLSNPEAPVQVGQLEIPGWVYHMEPRGERILAVGFDQDNADGALNVSLFDVSDFEDPQLLSRVHFGGDWANFAEDQDRIQKAFTILDEDELILVPYSGWSYDDDTFSCRGIFKSGVQLIDWADDALTLRGVASPRGESRRGFVHRGDLFAMSDKSLESYDISDRDAPPNLDALPLAVNVSSVTVDGMLVARLQQDWWNNEITLDFVTTETADAFEPLGAIDLSESFTNTDECGYISISGEDILHRDGYVYVLASADDGGYAGFDREGESKQQATLIVIDAREPSAPTVATTIELTGVGHGSNYYLPFGRTGRRMAIVGDTLFITAGDVTWRDNAPPQSTARLLRFDLIDTAAPAPLPSWEREDAMLHGDLYGTGDALFTWHARAASDDGAQVRYYLEPLNDADAPSEPLNVPGVPLALDPSGSRVVGLDIARVTQASTEEDCYDAPNVVDYHEGQCTRVRYSLTNAVLVAGGAALEGTRALDEKDSPGGMSASDRVLWLQLSGGYGYAVGDVAVGGDGPLPERPLQTLWAIDLEEEALMPQAIEVPGWPSLWNADAQAQRLVLPSDGTIYVIDAHADTSPSLTALEGPAWCTDVAIDGTAAYCAMGELGLTRIVLP